MTSRPNPRVLMREDLYDLFHDHWNLMTAVNSYILVLRHSPGVQGIDKDAVEELTRLMPMLEQSMEAIRVRIISLTA